MRPLSRSIVMLVLLVVGGVPAAFAQGAARQPGAARSAPLTPADVQRLFDAYTLSEAQDAVRLTDEQYGRFIPKLKALQTTRRRQQQERARLLRELGRLAGQPQPDETALREQLRALAAFDAAAGGELSKAYAALDEVLEPVQQARFRVFEENMERKKLELLMRARQRRLNRF